MYKIIFLAIVGALIGWLTNLIAIKLLFRPIKPIKIPILNIEFVGLIPKRREEIAMTIGKIIDEELISLSQILENLITKEDQERILIKFKERIRNIVQEKMPAFIPSSFKGMIADQIDQIIQEEGDIMIEELKQDISKNSSERINISEMITENINKFETERLEEIIIQIAKKELKHIEVLGGLLGFLIGLVQGIIIHLI